MGIVGAIATALGYPKSVSATGVAVTGVLFLPLLFAVVSFSRKQASTDIFIQQPQKPGAGTNRPFRVTGEVLRLHAEANIPDWPERTNICFQEEDGFSVELSGHPDGVRRLEGKNEFRVESGINQFDFTIMIKRTTNGGGTYQMEIWDYIHNHKLGEYEIEISQL